MLLQPGQYVAQRAMSECVERAKRHGFAVAVARNSNHLGAVGYYANMALAEDLIGFATTNGNVMIPPPGTRTPVVGNNPLAWAFPTAEEPPLCVDVATSVVAGGKIDLALADWSQRLLFSATLAEDERVAAYLAHPGLSQAEQVGLLLPEGDTPEGVYGRFLATLAENRRLPLLAQVAAQYELLRADAERVVKASVRSAVATGVNRSWSPAMISVGTSIVDSTSHAECSR